MARRRIARRLALGLLLMLAASPACRRSRGRSAAPNTSSSYIDARDVRCVERPEGCIWCEGRGPTPPLVEPDAIPPSLCDPKDPGECVDFCSRLAPECAVPWRTVPSCLLPTEQEFRREVFRRDTADRPEAIVQGRITDESARRIEGAKIRVWFQGTDILDDVSGKDGSYRLRLRAGPLTTYSLRVSHAGQATEIADLRIDRAGVTLRNFRLAPESTIRGRVTGSDGEPIGGVVIHAVRSPDDLVDAGGAQTQDDGTYAINGLDVKRYFLRASKFGWLPQMLKWGVMAPATRVGFKLVRTGVIEGRVLDADGEGQANATVVALPSASGGNAASPIIWAADTDGKFAQDRFEPGTYYLWARRGEMLVFPPEKIEISDDNLDARIELKLSHKGARVRGRIITRGGSPLDPDSRAVLFGQSPLALPRKAVGEIDHDGAFAVGALLPGRYEISVRVGTRVLSIMTGPREVEIPIEPGATVDLSDTIVVRPQAEE
ncbi:MAG TPA: carboxypeptidase regulatory-like domain-containing protein [Polyangia bacterium]|nr:carboxypeptidase regulatory-like domain-containing protein [Polyangia bacterium]